MKIIIIYFFVPEKIYSRRILEVVKSKSKAKHPPEHLKNLCQFVVERCNLYKRLKRKIKNIVTGEVGNLFMLNRPSGTKIKEIEDPELQGTEDGPHKTIRIVPVAGHEIHGKLENFYLLVENAAFMKCIVNTRKESFSFFITLFNKATNPIFVFNPLKDMEDENIPTFIFSSNSGFNEEIKLVLTAQIYKEPTEEEVTVNEQTVQAGVVNPRRFPQVVDAKGKKKVQ